ncbi:MAG TPA: hypothetical protein VHI93_04655, partial [Candidatus Thermoplasmatota archaeon]|nr:hypothetical protein [Candidatus Thermoplasmatota archaeon]
GCQAPGMAQNIYAVGNPGLWWGASLAVLAILAATGAAVGRNLWRGIRTPFGSLSRTRQALFVAALLPLGTFGGFALLARGPRTMFIFYMTLVVPFFALLYGGAVAALWRTGRPWARAGAGLACLLVLAGFLLYFPVAIYLPIPSQWSDAILGAIPWMRK